MGDHENLETVLERYHSHPFLFVEPGGNWGDYLIYRGAVRLAQKLGLNFVSVDYDTFLQRPPAANTAVYLHGGGGFNFIYHEYALKALCHALKNYSGPIIQGPQTSEDSAVYMQHLASHIQGAGNQHFYLFAREKVTWRNLYGAIQDKSIKIRLDHDTAFHLNREDLLGERYIRPKYDLLALREDSERPARDAPFRHLAGLRLDPPHYAKTMDHWVRIHAYSRSIITNRTHSAILSTVLGVPATLLPGSYHKNRSIWEYSLRERGVKWQDWPEESNAKPGRINTVLNRVRHSYKLNRLRLSLLPLFGVPRE